MADNANELFESLSRELNVPRGQIESTCQTGNADGLLKSIDSDKAKKVESILSDPEKTKEILSSPEAQALMKLLNNK